MSDQSLQKIEPMPVAPSVVEPITAAQAKIDAVASLTMSAYARASTLQLTAEEVSALKADFPDEAFQPGAAGKEHLIYIEHAHLRERLNSVFGPGQWAIVPRNRWAEDFVTGKGTEASRVYVEAMLCVRGCFVAEAIGEMEYWKNNASQNYGDAVEGAKTAALRRCAKELGIGLQAWKKEWTVGWWERKRPGTTRSAPAKPAPERPPPATAKPANATEAQRLKWIGMLRPLGQGALDYAYGAGWLRPPTGDDPGEPIETLSIHHVPTTKQAAADLLARIQRFMDAPRGEPQEEPEGGAQ